MSARTFSRIALPVLAAALVGGGCTKHARVERLLARANRDFEAGAYDKAEVEYNGARQLAPLDPVAIRQLGILYFDEGRATHAYAFLKKAVELDPKNVPARVKLGQVALAAGLPRDAREAAKFILTREPANEEALFLLTGTTHTPSEETETTQILARLRGSNKDCAGYHLAQDRMLILHRNFAAAKNEIRAAIALDPKSSAAYEDLGGICLLERDTKQAGEAYRMAARLSPLRSVRQLRDIEFRIRTGAATEAKKDLAELLEKAPDYISARVFAMKLCFAERRYDDCAAEIQAILARDSGNYDAVVERGVLKMAQNDAAGAVVDLKKAEELYPRSPQAKFELALAYARLGDTVRAADRLNAAILLSPNYSEAILLLADLNIRKGNAAAAIALLNPLLASSSRSRQAYLLLAQAYLTEKNPALALPVYQRMAAEFPSDPEPLYRAGLIPVQAGRLAEARQVFEKTAQIDPSYWPALEMLVKIDLAEKHESAAAGRVQDLIAKYPKLAGPWLLKGEIDLAAKRLDGAESDLRKAIELEPTSQQAYLALARLYIATHKTDAAIGELAALVDKTKSVTAQMQIAAIHSAMSQFGAAAADYRKLLSFDPKFGMALNNLAFIEAEDFGKLDEAYEIAKRAREASPEDANVADTLGWILFKKGDYHGALDLFQESAGRSPEDSSVQYHLGMAHYMLGEEQSARVAFERVSAGAAAGPDTPERGQARARLAVLAVDPATAGPEVRSNLEMRAKAEPNDPIVASRLAAIQERSGAAATAAAGFENALKLAPHNPQTMIELARLYAGPMREPAKARELAKSAHQLAPDDSGISETLGRLVYATGDFKWSVDLLEQASRSLPHEPELMYDLALAYYGVGRIADAEQSLRAVRTGGGPFSRKAEADRFAAMLAASVSPSSAEAAAGDARKILEADPGYVPALMVSGLAKEQEGDASGAGALYEKILEKNPLFAPATRQLARIYVERTGDDEKAYNLAVKAREAFPGDPDVARTLGIIDYRRGDYGGAERLFQESLRSLPNDAETVYYMGMSHYNLREMDESKAELQRALDLKLSDPLSDDAKRVLDEMKGDVQGPSLSSQPIN